MHLPAVFEVVRERFPDSTPYLLGHSMGGQLGVLYASRIRGRLGGLILVAAGTPYYRHYRGARRPGLLLGSAAMSLTSSVAGFWPGDRIDVAGFGRQSRVLISDWARLARGGRFDPAGADIDYEERLARLTLPVLSITIEGDELMGLARGFQYAGARALMASLWPVEDQAAADLMTRFYGHLAGRYDAQAALAATMREGIAEGRLPQEWAPFYLTGRHAGGKSSG